MRPTDQDVNMSAFDAVIDEACGTDVTNFDALIGTYDEGNPYAYCEKHDSEMGFALDEEIKADNRFASSGLSARELYYKEVSQYPLLSPEEEKEIAKRVSAGDAEAKLKLIQSNLRLVGYVCKRYLNYGADYDDLIQEGNLGLMEAADRFDYRKGYKFSTYAFWWIRRSVVRFIADQGYPITLPEKGHIDITKIKKSIENFIATHDDRNPTLEELSEITGLSTDRIQDLMRATTTPLSIYSPSYRNSNTSVGDSIQDVQAENPVDMSERESIFKLITEAMKDLSTKERRIIELRFGLVDGHARRLEEIGKEFGLTRERVRQIEGRAMNKIKASPSAASMKDFGASMA